MKVNHLFNSEYYLDGYKKEGSYIKSIKVGKNVFLMITAGRNKVPTFSLTFQAKSHNEMFPKDIKIKKSEVPKEILKLLDNYKNES